MKILVTGSTGFVGSHLCEKLENLGHEVFAQARNEEKFKHFKVPGKLIKGSLAYDSPNKWIATLPDDLDAVIHTAGVVHGFSIEQFYNINATATKQLINDLKARYNNLQFTLISSLSAMGPAVDGITRKEEHIPRPTSQYGKSKLLAEDYLKNLAPPEWRSIIIRPPMVIGPRDPAVLDIFKMVKSRVVLFAGIDGKNKTYSYVCVFDLVEVISNAVENIELKNEVFLAAFPKVITLNELVKEIKKQMNCTLTFDLTMPMLFIKLIAKFLERIAYFIKIEARLTPDKLHELAPMAWTCQSNKSIEKLGIKYRWDLSSTIEVTLHDYKKRGLL